MQGEKQSEKKRGDEREKEWTKKRRTGFWDGSKDVLFPWFSGVLLVDSNSSLRNSDIPQKDAYCGLRRDLFPAPNCTSTEELNDVVCFGLSHVPWRNAFKNGMCH